MLYSAKGTTPDDLATIIFSSGSTGDPKGIMLSHQNILSNIESFQKVLNFDGNDRLCAVLPFFHSFGFTATLWAPLVTGFQACYHPNPIEGAAVAQLVRERKLTMLFATPTFLLTYMAKAKEDDFRSLRLIVTGAEKLKKKLADKFEARFGIRPMEGYGATECSPVIATNVADSVVGGVVKVGCKDGSVGRPVPGVAVKVVHPETREQLGENEEGLLLVKGPK